MPYKYFVRTFRRGENPGKAAILNKREQIMLTNLIVTKLSMYKWRYTNNTITDPGYEYEYDVYEYLMEFRIITIPKMSPSVLYRTHLSPIIWVAFEAYSICCCHLIALGIKNIGRVILMQNYNWKSSNLSQPKHLWLGFLSVHNLAIHPFKLWNNSTQFWCTSVKHCVQACILCVFLPRCVY